MNSSERNYRHSDNLAPVSSFWALGWTIVLGVLRDTKTLENLERNPGCVVNLPGTDLWPQVELLAPLTGLNPSAGGEGGQVSLRGRQILSRRIDPAHK